MIFNLILIFLINNILNVELVHSLIRFFFLYSPKLTDGLNLMLLVILREYLCLEAPRIDHLFDIQYNLEDETFN